ncbi:MAG: nucleotidyltransferase domain-containing protein [Nanoarchaeota archaeon]|nr:nucleotidyltransferase domain-containing protein [Nanoarchaeota archaeon]
MLNKESGILYFFAAEPWKKYTFTQLRKASKKKSKSYLALVLNNLVREGIIKQERIGRLPIYSLNTSSAKARSSAGFVLEHKGLNKKHIPYDSMEKVMQKIPTSNYVFIITGSYAKNTQTEKSDIDVVILVDDAVNTKKLYAELSITCEMNIPSIHLYVFKNNEFMDMLLNKQANYGKEIVKNCLVLTGGQVYIKILGEAISHGFNG